MATFILKCPWCGTGLSKSVHVYSNGKGSGNSGLCNKCRKPIRWWVENNRAKIVKDQLIRYRRGKSICQHRAKSGQSICVVIVAQNKREVKIQADHILELVGEEEKNNHILG